MRYHFFSRIICLILLAAAFFSNAYGDNPNSNWVKGSLSVRVAGDWTKLQVTLTTDDMDTSPMIYSFPNLHKTIAGQLLRQIKTPCWFDADAMVAAQDKPFSRVADFQAFLAQVVVSNKITERPDDLVARIAKLEAEMAALKNKPSENPAQPPE